MAKHSAEHAQASLSEHGVWTCAWCRSESMDYELFEENGQFEDCLRSFAGDGPILGGNAGSAEALAKAKAWVNAYSNEMREIEKASISASKKLSATGKIFSPSSQTNNTTIHWTTPKNKDSEWLEAVFTKKYAKSRWGV